MDREHIENIHGTKHILYSSVLKGARWPLRELLPKIWKICLLRKYNCYLTFGFHNNSPFLKYLEPLSITYRLFFIIIN